MDEYIYLLQDRELKICKICKTKQNYREGSKLLVQLICNNSDIIINEIIKLFTIKYKRRKDIGNEYFEGDYKGMIIDIMDIYKIYLINLELNNLMCFDFLYNKYLQKLDKYNNLKNIMKDGINNNKGIDDGLLEELETEIYSSIIISNYKDFLKFSKIKNIIITDYDKLNPYISTYYIDHDIRFIDNICIKGYIRCTVNGSYKEICPLTQQLYGWLNKNYNHFIYIHKVTRDIVDEYESIEDTYGEYNCITLELDYQKIIEDILDKCYNPNVKIDKLEYNEYITNYCNENSNISYQNKIFNASLYTLYDLSSNKIILYQQYCSIKFKIIEEADMPFFNELMDIFINKNIQQKIKKIFKHIFIEEHDEINIFYDYYEDSFSYRIKYIISETAFALTGNTDFCHYCHYCNFDTYKNDIIHSNTRCIIINNGNGNGNGNYENIIDYYSKKGIKNIIISIKSIANNYYNNTQLLIYIKNNYHVIKKYINFNEDEYIRNHFEKEIFDLHNKCEEKPIIINRLFSADGLAYNHLLRWCIF